MTLALEDIRRIANLSHLELNDEEAVRMQGELNNIFKMIERIQAVDTDGLNRCRTLMMVLSVFVRTLCERSMIGKTI